jgi:hypothetical protein
MNLQEFIEQTLLQVAQATKNASEKMKASGLGEGVRDNQAIDISFDIALTVSHESKSDITGGLKVLNALKLGGETGEAIKSENVSRIKLELPLKVSGAKTPISVVG